MKLHTRLVLLLAVTFGIFLSIAASIIYSVIQPAFEKLEQAEAATNVTRVQKAFGNEVASLDQQLLDWANWDDTKDFALNRTPSYIESNLNAASITNIGLSFMAFYGLDGNPVWAGGFDAETHEMNTPPELSDPTVIRRFLSSRDRPLAMAGLWSAGSGSYLLAARPILDSEGAGEPAGTAVFGVVVDADLLAKLREQTEVGFTIASLPPGGERSMLRTDVATETARSDDVLTHSIGWNDLLGETRIRIDVETPRQISAIGSNTITLAMMSLVSAALLDMVVIGLAITLLVARPVRSLTQQVTGIAGSGDLSVRLAWNRRDELGTLAAQFDHMIGELADARRKLAEMSYKIGRSDVAAGVLHNVRNALSPLANQIQRGRQILATAGGAHVAQAVAELADPATAADRRGKLAAYLSASLEQERDLRRAAAEEMDRAAEGLATVEHILAHQQETADLTIAPQDLTLAEIVKEALKQTSTAIAGIAVSVSPSVEHAPKVRAHQPIAVHVLHNVIANAVAAVKGASRPDRRIEISAHPTGAGQVVLEVRDNGVGIAAEDLPELFRSGFTTKPGGKGGEGLHWCANALAKLKGRIWAESAGKNGGATFFIEFAAA